MVYVIQNSDGTIKSFTEDPASAVPLNGETVTSLPVSMEEYASRFMLSYRDVCCYTVTAHVGDPEVEINVYAPGHDSVAVDVNGISQVVPLQSAKGVIHIGTEIAGDFFLSPTEKNIFCTAGNGSLCVMILP